MCSPVPSSLFEHTSSFSLSFYSITLSISVYLLHCQPLHPLIYSFPVPQSPISVCCHAHISPIRKGNEARYRCKYLGPLAAPWLIIHRQKQGWSEEDRRESDGGRGGRACRLDRGKKSEAKHADDWYRMEKGGLSVKAEFINMEKDFFSKYEREHKLPNILHYFSFSLFPPSSFVVWLFYHWACTAISALLRGHSFSLPLALSISLAC